MHFHHKHDIDGCTADHSDWPDWLIALFATIDRRDLQLMSAVQADLDAATAVITELVTKISDLEAKAGASSPALDSTKLNAEVAAAQALINPTPAAPAQAPVEGSAAEESAETPAQAAAEPDAVPVPAAQPAAEQPAPAAVPAAPVPFPSVPLA